MNRNIISDKSHNWRIKWVSGIEFETKIIFLSFIQRIRRTIYVHYPSENKDRLFFCRISWMKFNFRYGINSAKNPLKSTSDQKKNLYKICFKKLFPSHLFRYPYEYVFWPNIGNKFTEI